MAKVEESEEKGDAECAAITSTTTPTQSDRTSENGMAKEESAVDNVESKPLSKNAQKKAARLARLKASREERRRRERENRKKRRRREGDGVAEDGERMSKRDRKRLEVEKLRQGMEEGAKLAVHLGFESMMSEREMGSLAAQVRRAYGANRTACDGKVALWLLGLPEDGPMTKVMKEQNDGFDNWVIGRSCKGPEEEFPASSIVYLSPDAEQPLEAPLDAAKCHVIGGLSDGTVVKGASAGYAANAGVQCRRLPIQECCAKASGTFSQVLTVNTVFEILRDMLASGSDSWTEVFKKHLPQRNGWVPK